MQPRFAVNFQPMHTNHLIQSHLCPPFEQHDPYQIGPQPGQLYASPLQQYTQPMPLPTKSINSYVIDYSRKIGNGNFSNVFIAMDQRTPNYKLAVKVINALNLRQQNLEHLVKSQVEILLAMRHENVIFCKDVFWDETYCYIFTEYCDGGTLQSKIKKRLQQNMPLMHPNYFYHQQNNFHAAQDMIYSSKGIKNQNTLIYPNLSEYEMLPIIKDIFYSMLYLQSCHIIHRDIKAANIFLKENKAIVADFGFARYVNEPFKDLQIGSLPFMAPQALSRNIYNNKTDVWAFGILLYEIFHGESPFAKAHDMKELIQCVYKPFSVRSLRSDLTTQMKQLILTCLEIDFQKRKGFSEIQKTWFFKKLFQNVGHYNFGYNVVRSKNIEKVATDPYPHNVQNNECMPVFRGDENHIHIKNGGNGRSFGSRFKDKVNVGSSSWSMNYSNSSSNSNGKQCDKNCGIHQFCDPNKKFINNQESESPRIGKRNIYKINFNVVSPMNHQQNMVQKINHDHDQNQLQQINLNLHHTSSVKHLPECKIQGPYKNNINNVMMYDLQKMPFKNVLLRIQQIRNYYKLAMLLKDRNKTITQIKNRLFIKSVKEIKKIQKLIQKDAVDLTSFQKTKKIKQDNENDKKDQKNASISNRKTKLCSIIKDYKVQFENQLRRRNIILTNTQIDNNLMKSGYFQDKNTELQIRNLLQVPQTNGQKLNLTTSNKTKGNSNKKVPSLSQDIEYVIQSQLLCHPEYDNKNGDSEEECQNYRIKVKEILEDIMHVEKGFLNTESATNQSLRIAVKSGTNLMTVNQSNGGELTKVNIPNIPPINMIGKNSLHKKTPKEQFVADQIEEIRKGELIQKKLSY